MRAGGAELGQPARRHGHACADAEAGLGGYGRTENENDQGKETHGRERWADGSRRDGSVTDERPAAGHALAP